LAEKALADLPDLIVCAGWLRVFGNSFLDPVAERHIPVINLHPALPGAFDGKDAVKRAYDDHHKGKLEHDRIGVMVHFVTKDVDRGMPILVREIECKAPETLEELSERLHQEEHKIIVKGTALAISALWDNRRHRTA
jgi:phosphoribosylglycinamide formyltransferase